MDSRVQTLEDLSVFKKVPQLKNTYILALGVPFSENVNSPGTTPGLRFWVGLGVRNRFAVPGYPVNPIETA